MTYYILVTGSRYATEEDLPVIAAYLAEARLVGVLKGDTPKLIHGAAPGVDRLADKAWTTLVGNRVDIEEYPANWSNGKSAGPLRNQVMVDLGPATALAFPIREQRLQPGDSRGNRGTMDCVQRILKAEVSLKVVWL